MSDHGEANVELAGKIVTVTFFVMMALGALAIGAWLF